MISQENQDTLSKLFRSIVGRRATSVMTSEQDGRFVVNITFDDGSGLCRCPLVRSRARTRARLGGRGMSYINPSVKGYSITTHEVTVYSVVCNTCRQWLGDVGDLDKILPLTEDHHEAEHRGANR